jgi:hypothetical protein
MAGIIKQNNYETAYNEAVNDLLHRNINDVAVKSEARLISQSGSACLELRFFNDIIIITHPQITLNYKSKNSEISMWTRILLLHYLIQANGTLATGEQITFNQIPGGLGYYPAFQRRTIKPLLKLFGNNLNGFASAAERLGGIRSNISNFSFLFKIFPRISILLNLWEGDEEFPVDGNIVFDSSITDYLTAEDIAVMCNMTALMIIKSESQNL